MAMNAGNKYKTKNNRNGRSGNRKLAMLVSMALGVSVAYGMVPSEVALAAEHVIQYLSGQYYVDSRSYTTPADLREDLDSDVLTSVLGYDDTLKIILDGNLSAALMGQIIAVGPSITVKAVPALGILQIYDMTSTSNGFAHVCYTPDGGLSVGGQLSSLTVHAKEGYSNKIDLSAVTEGNIFIDADNVAAGTLNIITKENGSAVSKLSLIGSTGGIGVQVTGGNLSVGTLIVGSNSVVAAADGKNIAATDAVEAPDGSKFKGVIFNGGLTVEQGAEVTVADSKTDGLILNTQAKIKTDNGNITVTGGDVRIGGMSGIDAGIGTLDFSRASSISIANFSSIKAGSIDAGNSQLCPAIGVTITAGSLSAYILDLNQGGTVNTGSVNVNTLYKSGTLDSNSIGGLTSLTAASVPGVSRINLPGVNLTLNNAVHIGRSNTITGITAGNIKMENLYISDNAILSGTNVTAGNLDVYGNADLSSATNLSVIGVNVLSGKAVTFNNLKVSSGTYNNPGGTVKANSVTLGSGISIAGNSTLATDNLTLEANGDWENKLANLRITSATAGQDVHVNIEGLAELEANNPEAAEALKAAVRSSAGSNVIINSVAPGGGNATVDEALEKVEVVKEKLVKWTTADAEVVAKADPFVSKLPTAEELNQLTSDEQIAHINEAKAALDAAEEAARQANDTVALAKISAMRAELPEDEAGLQRKKAQLIAAIQQAGKTAAAPAVTSARAAAAITNVLNNNVVNRTAEIRSFASAVDEGRTEPDNMWFQYKHTQMDVDGGDVYGTSTVNTNNFQLGYDTQIGVNDYLGAYIGTSTGHADFTGPARSGRIELDNSFDFGVYGTHMLPNDQYIEYMVHNGRFDSEYDGSNYGTMDTGAMVGYGAKLAQNDRLTWNPYVQLAYDRISVDTYATRAGNVIKSDDSSNWTAKLGVNLIDVSGLYGGVAYSCGLSGSYNAYINGVAMPASDNDANVLYLSLGYRANMAKNAVLDLSMEKTFMDYKGWTATGKMNFYF